MKKILSILALALCFVACQNDGVENATNGGLVDVVLTVDAPELGVTRANDGDKQNGKNSAFGAIDFLSDADWANYDLRYILEVYADNETGEGTPIYSERLVNCLDKYAPTTFALRLVPNRSYKFVVFADFVAEGNAELTEPADKLAIADLYYNTADLRNITAITAQPTWGAMNEIRDAYFVSDNIKIENNGMTHGLTLTRPFAKLRVITTDLSYINGYATPGYVEVTYHDTDVFKSFNAVNGNLNTEKMAGEELTYGYNVSKTIPYTEGYDAFATNQTLFTDYLFAVAGQQTTVKFTMAIYEEEGGRMIHSHDFNTEIPIQRNHLTTIIGDLCTTQANITFDINDNFEDEFVIGWDDSYTNKITIDSWSVGQLTQAGDYAFTLSAEGEEFTVTVNGEAVENAVLAEGSYVLAEDAAEGNIYTFTVEGLKANATTRAMTGVNVIGGKMVVEKNEAGYSIELNLVVEFAAEEFVRYSSYTYEGAISINKPAIAAPVVEATVEGNVVTLTWNKVEGAAKYSVAYNGTKISGITGLTRTFTLKYNTKYTFEVVAYPTNDAKYSQSEAGTVTVTTEAESVQLTAPEVTASAEGNVVTATWTEVENAAKYSVTVNDAAAVEVEDTTYTFDGEYDTEYTISVVAVAAEGSNFTDSEAGVATVTTEAEVNAIQLTSMKSLGARANNYGTYYGFELSNTDGHKVDLSVSFSQSGLDYIDAGEYRRESTENLDYLEYAFHAKYYLNGSYIGQSADSSAMVVERTNNVDYNITLALIIDGVTYNFVCKTTFVVITTLETPNVTATVNGNTIAASWNDVAGAGSYVVKLNGVEKATVTTTSYTFENLDYSTEYTIAVVAKAANTTTHKDSAAGSVTVTTADDPNAGGGEGGNDEWAGREVKLSLLAYDKPNLYTKVNNESKYFKTEFRGGIVAGTFVLAGDNKSYEIATAGYAASQYGLFGSTTPFADGDTVEVIDNGGSYTIIYRVTVSGEKLTATYTGVL